MRAKVKKEENLDKKIPGRKPTARKDKIKFKPGRPAKVIDWQLVDNLLMAGCSGKEIAGNFGIIPDTLYDNVAARYNVSFTEYQQSMRAKGLGLLRAKSFDKAFKGDNTQLNINLKTFCGYHEGRTEPEYPNDKVLDDLLAEVKMLKHIVNPITFNNNFDNPITP